MAKNAVADWDTTAANNTDIGGTDITGTTGLVKNGDNAIRAIMAQIKAGVPYLSSTSVVMPSSTAALVADADDGASLGTTAVQWSDLFLASGGVINWANSDSTLTHSAGLLTSTANLTISRTAPLLRMSAASAANGILSYQTAGSDRWYVYKDNTAESGANAGSNLSINRYDDSGNYLGTPVVINRTTGVITVGNGLVSSHPTLGVGYSAGAGGTVTQATNKSTGVTLSKVSGAITMNNAALGAGTIVSFVLTNTAIAATDVLILNHISGGTVGSYTLNAQCAAGSATINVRNNTGGPLSEAIVIQFVLVKGANA